MLLVLALLWGGFFLYWLRSHAKESFGDSVGSFRRDLNVLERSAPSTMRAANRLRIPQPVAPTRASLPARRPTAPQMRPVPGRADAVAPPVGAPSRRRQTVKRRRDVLFVLAVVAVATLVMAAATRSHALITAQLLADVALGGYVALLVRMRNLAAEREIKLSYLSRARTVAPSRRRYEEVDGGYGELALRRAAN
jgi:hypothetical protein